MARQLDRFQETRSTIFFGGVLLSASLPTLPSSMSLVGGFRIVVGDRDEDGDGRARKREGERERRDNPGFAAR